MVSKIDLTIGVTAHNEGIVAHKTMLSIFAATEKLKEAGVNYEILIHIDNGDKETIEYFKRYEDQKLVTILQNKFGDPGQSRNYITKKAKGRYLGFVDADDLLSDNWFLEAIEALRKSKEVIIVHPEASLTFGNDQHVLWIQHDSFGETRDLKILCGVNRWILVSVAERKVFLDNPYPKSSKGYGHEDWWFNSETEAKGIRHRIVKNTMQFYRRNKMSVLTINNSRKHIQWYSELFDIESCKKKCQKAEVENNEKKSVSLGRRKAYRIYKKIRDSKASIFINPVARPIKILVDKIQDSGRPTQERKQYIPDFVIKEWKKITKIEPQLYPTKQEQKNVVRYYSDERDEVGEAYLKAVSDVKKMPDYIFVVPWLVSGGADKVMLNYIKALSVQHKNWSFAVITTLPSKNTWEDKLPDNAYIVDFGSNSDLLIEEEKEILFARILTQLKCKRLHLINSEFGYCWIADHKELIAKNYNLNVSVFCHDYIPGTNNEAVFDYMDPFLVSIYDVVDKIFTDNKAVIEKGVEKCGFDKEKFEVHYQPLDDEFRSTERKRGKKLRILWAGRIAYQKCPEILCEVARRAGDDVRIEVFGRLDGYNKEIFDGIRNLKYMGGYDGFNSLDTSSYDLYLYTSNIDGIPNCLLEAAAAGLPIIAPNVGGIGEFIINRKTGILVDKFDDIDGFAEAIDYAKKHSREMQEMAVAAQKLLKKQHSWQSFEKVVKKDIK